MTRALIALALVLSAATAALADVTLKQSVTGKGMGMGGTTQSTTYIKGNKMRTETTIGDHVQTQIFDLDAQKMYMFDSKKKEVDVWDMAAFAQEMPKSVDMSNMTVSFKPNGQTKQIGGKTATGYDIEISLPTTMPATRT